MTWSGGATAAQLVRLLDGALAPAKGGADAALRRGDAAFGKNDLAGAEAAYKEALALGGAGWAGREHAVEQWVGVLQVKDPAACTRAAAAEGAKLDRAGHAFVNVAVLGMACGYSDPAATPESELGQALEKQALAAVDSKAASEDDRYMLFESMSAARVRAKDDAGLKALAERYLAVVEAAPTGDGDRRLARDLARLRAALKLGKPERAIPALEATEKAVPRDPNPSQWLATAYMAAGRADDAIAACTRGLARSPSATVRARLLMTRGGAEAKKGNQDAARRDLEAALEAAKGIPVAEARAGIEQGIKARLGDVR